MAAGAQLVLGGQMVGSCYLPTILTGPNQEYEDDLRTPQIEGKVVFRRQRINRMWFRGKFQAMAGA